MPSMEDGLAMAGAEDRDGAAEGGALECGTFASNWDRLRETKESRGGAKLLCSSSALFSYCHGDMKV